MANIGDSIRSGAKWLLAGSIARQILQFMIGVVLARLLVPADFGMIITVQVFTGFAGMVMSGGMGQSLIRAKEVDDHDFNAVFTMQLAMSIVIYLSFFLAAPLIAEYFANPIYEDLVRVSTLVFLLKPFAFMYNSWLNREMNFKTRSLVTFATGIVTGISGIVMAWFGMGVWSLTFSGLLGALFSNLLLGRLLPLRLALNPNFTIMRKHSAYGLKITANDFLSYLTRESKNLILSKVGGPHFLGLFNKAESLSRTPNDLIMPATMQPVFRALSTMQDDLDKSKYLLYRAITLLTVYTMPLYIWFWWVAEPFIGTLYGDKWIASAEPLSILALSGIFFNILFPCGRLLDAQNKLSQESVVLILRLAVVIAACLVGLNWGLTGVAWGVMFGNIFGACCLYYLVYRTLHTRLRELFEALAPGLLLGSFLFAALALVHISLGESKSNAPILYLLIMTVAGVTMYAGVFLLIPIPTLRSESVRWRGQLRNLAVSVRKMIT